MIKTLSITVSCLVALIAIGYFMMMGAGKPISTDLSVIGQGKPALVLAYENYSPAGGDALNRLRQVRADYDARLHFVVADMGTPQGLAFTQRYQLIDGKVIFLKPDGQPLDQSLQATSIPEDEGALRRLLDKQLTAILAVL